MNKNGASLDLAAGDSLFLPPKIADLLDRLRAIGVSPRTVQIERDGWILLAARHSQVVPVRVLDLRGTWCTAPGHLGGAGSAAWGWPR